MSEDNSSSTPATTEAPATTHSSDPGADWRSQLRAVSAERSRLRDELKAAQEQITALKTAQTQNASRYEQDLHLTGLGITSKRGRRAIRREYADAIAEANGDDKPQFGEFVQELRDDPLYGRWFSTAADKPVDNAAAAVDKVVKKRKPAGNPNGGATAPKQPAADITLEDYRARRAKLGRSGALAASLEALKKQGIVS